MHLHQLRQINNTLNYDYHSVYSSRSIYNYTSINIYTIPLDLAKIHFSEAIIAGH